MLGVIRRGLKNLGTRGAGYVCCKIAEGRLFEICKRLCDLVPAVYFFGLCKGDNEGKI